jgi:hypothetical protein
MAFVRAKNGQYQAMYQVLVIKEGGKPGKRQVSGPLFRLKRDAQREANRLELEALNGPTEAEAEPNTLTFRATRRTSWPSGWTSARAPGSPRLSGWPG